MFFKNYKTHKMFFGRHFQRNMHKRRIAVHPYVSPSCMRSACLVDQLKFWLSPEFEHQPVKRVMRHTIVFTYASIEGNGIKLNRSSV